MFSDAYTLHGGYWSFHPLVKKVVRRAEYKTRLQWLEPNLIRCERLLAISGAATNQVVLGQRYDWRSHRFQGSR